MLHRPRISQRVLFTPRSPGKSYNPISKSTHCKEKQIAVIHRWAVFTNNSLKKCFRNACPSLSNHVSHIVGNLTSCVSKWHNCGCPFPNQSSPVFQSGAFKAFETSGSLLLSYPTCLCVCVKFRRSLYTQKSIKLMRWNKLKYCKINGPFCESIPELGNLRYVTLLYCFAFNLPLRTQSSPCKYITFIRFSITYMSEVTIGFYDFKTIPNLFGTGAVTGIAKAILLWVKSVKSTCFSPQKSTTVINKVLGKWFHHKELNWIDSDHLLQQLIHSDYWAGSPCILTLHVIGELKPDPNTFWVHALGIKCIPFMVLYIQRVLNSDMLPPATELPEGTDISHTVRYRRSWEKTLPSGKCHSS